MGSFAIRKPLTGQDRAAARKSMEGLNQALTERLGRDLNDVQVVVWMSDLHLHKDTAYESLPMHYQTLVDTDRHFELAMEEAKALKPSADVLILGGDMTDYGMAEEWKKFRKLYDQIGWPTPMVPAFGNHDNANRTTAHCGDEKLDEVWNEIKRDEWPAQRDPEALYYSVVHEGLKFVVLDTVRDGLYYVMPEREKAWLRKELANTDMPTLVVCHVHQLEVGIYLDRGSIFRDKEAWSILDECPHVIGVFSGHIHYPNLWQYRNKQYATFPSTAVGIGAATGWGGIILRNKKIEAVFTKEIYGEGYDTHFGPTKQAGDFVIMEPKLFQNSILCSPYYWTFEPDPAKRN